MKFKFYAIKLAIVLVLIFLLQISIEGFTEMFLLNQISIVEPWRFVTSIFLHGDVMHLLYNGLALVLFGSILERFIGGRRFLLVYFTTGVFANLISLNFYNSSLGASGAIFGVIGAIIVIRPLLVVWAFGLPMPIFIAGALWAIGDVIGVFVPSNVGNVAHLSGMFLGLIFGLLYRNWARRKEKKNSLSLNENYMRRWEDHYLK